MNGVATYTQIKGRTFCRFGLFPARPPGADDAAAEWRRVTEGQFKVQSTPATGSYTTPRGIPTTVTLAEVRDQARNEPYALASYALRPDGATGSLVVISNDMDTIKSCPVRALLDSIEVVGRPAVPVAVTAPAPQTVPASTAATPAESIVGAWATASGNPGAASGTGSVSRRQYTFKADGSFTYFSEVFDGYSTWIHVREAGTYQVHGAQLTIAPSSSTISSRDWTSVRNSRSQALEKVTYTFRKHYFAGLREWHLVLTPERATERDGPFAVNNQFPNSYLLSATFRPEWKWP